MAGRDRGQGQVAWGVVCWSLAENEDLLQRLQALLGKYLSLEHSTIIPFEGCRKTCGIPTDRKEPTQLVVDLWKIGPWPGRKPPSRHCPSSGDPFVISPGDKARFIFSRHGDIAVRPWVLDLWHKQKSQRTCIVRCNAGGSLGSGQRIARLTGLLQSTNQISA